VYIYDHPAGLIAKPLLRTSPATNEALRECFLRAAFQTDQQYSDINLVSTYASLGSISHHLLEVASRGEFDDISEDVLEEAIRERWMECVQSEVQSLQDRTIISVPLPVKWPKYALRMVAACRAAFRITLKRRGKRSEAEHEFAANQTEVWYEGYSGKLVGRIDLIRHTSSGIELVDYKSGLVIEQDEIDGTSKRIKEPYERQVLLYAALVYENERQWPIMVTVESLVDGPHIVRFTPEAARQAVDEALRLLDTYNRQAAARSIRGAPSPSTCYWCGFKAFCTYFLEAADISWSGFSTTVIGKVKSIHLDYPSSISLDITGGDHHKGLANIRGIPMELTNILNGSEDDIILLSNIKRTPGSNDLLFDWSSMLWR